MYWDAFKQLDDARDGMGGGISCAQVEDWCRLHGFTDVEDWVDFWDVIRRVDVHRRRAPKE